MENNLKVSVFKTMFIACLILFTISSRVSAQNTYSEGLISGFFSGIYIANNNSLENKLQSSLGSDFKLNNIAWTAGGGGKYLFKKRWMFGLEGQHVQFLDSKNEKGQVSNQRYGTKIAAGYAIINKEHWVAFSFIGYSFDKNLMLLINNSDHDFLIDGNNKIESKTSEEYYQKISTVALGINTNTLFTKEGKGGAMGIETGISYSMPGKFNNNFNRPVDGLGNRSQVMYYFRISISGAYFYL